MSILVFAKTNQRLKMEDADIKKLLDVSDRLIAEVPMDYRRYMYSMNDYGLLSENERGV